MTDSSGNLAFEKRSSQILEYLDAHGTISVDTVVSLCGVSFSTARTQLGKMGNMNLLTRVHGGAMKNEGISSEPSSRISFFKEKERIAAAAANLILPGETVAIAGGTTAQCFARALKDAKNIVVVTNSINIAAELKDSPNVEVHLSGGVLRSLNGACTGRRAEAFFEHISASKSFIGVDSVDEKAGFTVLNPDERADQAVMNCAAKKYALFDHSKFQKGPFVDCLASFSDIDACITDKDAKKEDVEMLKHFGIEVILV